VINIVGFRSGVFKVKQDTLANADVATDNLIECLNTVLRHVAKVKPGPSLTDDTSIALVAPYTTGTVQLTQGLLTVTGIDTAWTADMVGRAFSISGGTAIYAMYRIASVEGDTSLTLDTPWVDASVSTPVAYTIAKDRYTLPLDFNEIVSASLEAPDPRILEILSPSNFEYQRHMQRTKPLTTGTPSYITVYPRTSSAPTDASQCVFDPFPSAVGKMHLVYSKSPYTFTHDDGALYMPYDDTVVDIIMAGTGIYWRYVAGVQGADVAWQNWQERELANFSAQDQKQTDEQPRLQPGGFRGTQPSRV
jgi:hypothetical protein